VPARPERAPQSQKGTGLTRRPLALLVLALALLAVAGGTAASTAWAGGGAGALLTDASDGVVNGTYGAATVRSALSMVRSDPAYTMYSDIEGVLVDYLASISGSGGGGGGGTPRPVGVNTPGSTSSGGEETPGDTSSTKDSPGASGTQTPTPASSAAGVPLSPSPSATAWDQAKSRLAAAPWLFALPVAAIVAVGVILLRRRRSA
jgi:hypothetical protein